MTHAANGKGVVLITGINGYIAAHAAAAFLEAGYSVRGTLRVRNSMTDKLLEILGEYGRPEAVEIVEVPDITVPGVFNEAVKGRTSSLHAHSTHSRLI